MVLATHEGLRRSMQQEGLDKAKRSFPLRRYLLERHDIGMDAYMQQHLSAEDTRFIGQRASHYLKISRLKNPALMSTPFRYGVSKTLMSQVVSQLEAADYTQEAAAWPA